ncbi:MAG: energy transducer TonB [Bacteroidales bacterium]|nr:energy transducer TonB [Bacteroidales bacterium]MCF8332982.1 energy transducer TonB [Bacteroidales bacterium]
MEPKKSPKADLENKRTIFLQIGLVVALAITLAAFEWKSYGKQEQTLQKQVVKETPEEMVPITKQEKEPPPPEAPKSTTELNIVEDEVDVEDEVVIDVTADEDTEVEEYEPAPMEEEEKKEDKVFVVVEDQPQFPGGEKARKRYLSNNIEYPQLARESGIEGTVYVTFVVEKDGSITDVRVLRGIGGGCDKEAIRVVKEMPKWKPGKQRGKPVRVQFNMPIRFTLQ